MSPRARDGSSSASSAATWTSAWPESWNTMSAFELCSALRLAVMQPARRRVDHIGRRCGIYMSDVLVLSKFSVMENDDSVRHAPPTTAASVFVSHSEKWMGPVALAATVPLRAP